VVTQATPLCVCVVARRRGGPDAASAVTAVRIGRGFPRSPPGGPHRFDCHDQNHTGDGFCPSGVEADTLLSRSQGDQSASTLSFLPCGVDSPNRATSKAQVRSQYALKPAGQGEDIDSSRQG
jgi:hypothetical protein